MDDLNANEPRAGKMTDEIAAMHPGERFQLMFGIPELPPAWKVHAGLIGIETEQDETGWIAKIELFGKVESELGDTEQQAVNLLIYKHNLKKGKIEE